MIIHSYLTHGLIPWAKLFLESFKHWHAEKYKIILSTRDLNDLEIESLKKIYSNLIVKNKVINIEEISLKSGIDIFKLQQYKEEIEHDVVNETNKIWKQAISVEDRYRNTIVETMEEFMNERYMIHFDIDLLIRKPLFELFEIIMSNDISLRFRLHHEKNNRKLCGGLIGFKLNDKMLHLMYTWQKHIDKIPLLQKPIGYGQTSLYYTYLELKDQYRWGHIPKEYLSVEYKQDDKIFSANTSFGKDFMLNIFKQELRKMKTGGNK